MNIYQKADFKSKFYWFDELEQPQMWNSGNYSSRISNDNNWK